MRRFEIQQIAQINGKADGVLGASFALISTS
jgi:hypothetical protein